MGWIPLRSGRFYHKFYKGPCYLWGRPVLWYNLPTLPINSCSKNVDHWQWSWYWLHLLAKVVNFEQTLYCIINWTTHTLLVYKDTLAANVCLFIPVENHLAYHIGVVSYMLDPSAFVEPEVKAQKHRCVDRRGKANSFYILIMRGHWLSACASECLNWLLMSMSIKSSCIWCIYSTDRICCHWGMVGSSRMLIGRFYIIRRFWRWDHVPHWNGQTQKDDETKELDNFFEHVYLFCYIEFFWWGREIAFVYKTGYDDTAKTALTLYLH